MTLEEDRRGMSCVRTLAVVFFAAVLTMLPSAKASGA
jgi:hypothetical protein